MDTEKKRFLPLLWCASLVRPWFFHCPVPAAHTAFLYQKPRNNWLLEFPAPMVWWPRGPHARTFPQHFLRELFSGVRYLPVNTLPGISSGGFLAMSEAWHFPITASLGTSEADSQPVLLVDHHADFSAIQQATTAHFPTRSDFSAGGRSLGALSQPWGSRLLLIYTIPMLCVGFFW